MWLQELYRRYLGRPATGRASRVTAARRLTLEELEDRTCPSNFTAASVSDLIAAINKANKHGGSNTITLKANQTFTLVSVDNFTNGPAGLPVIAAKNNLTIIGNGDVIERSTASGTPAFRLFDVAAGGSLTLQNLTLQGGAAIGGSTWAEGGAIYNLGTLDLNGVTAQNNLAEGKYFINVYPVVGVAAPSGAGGAIYSATTLTLEGATRIVNNTAQGSLGASTRISIPIYPFYRYVPTPSGGSLGGGVYVAGGTATLSSAVLSGNTAQGPTGQGGGLFVAGGKVILSGTTVTANSAQGYRAEGGGIWSSGTLTVAGGAIQNNQALGANGIDAHYVAVGSPRGPAGIVPRVYVPAGQGGSAAGGGLYVAGGSAALSGLTVSNNIAQGGQGGHNTNPNYPYYYQAYSGAGGTGAGGGVYVLAGSVNLTGVTVTGNGAFGGRGDWLYRLNIGYPSGGSGFGGGLYAAGGTVTLRNDTATSNNAQAGYSGTVPSLGKGGGLYIDPAAGVMLDAFTQADVINNTASTSDPDIFGLWTPL